jgi:hypothetical protein
MEDKSYKSAVFHPRQPEASPLWRLCNNHYEGFEQCYEERFGGKYGFFRRVIGQVVRQYLTCGDLKNGFARVRCCDCRDEYLLAFSCKGRWFCPSCHAKKVVQFGESLRDTILYPVPHRQYVFTIPVMLRLYFKYYQGSESAPFSGVRKYPGVRDNKWATYRYFLTFLGSKDRFYLLLVLFLVLI